MSLYKVNFENRKMCVELDEIYIGKVFNQHCVKYIIISFEKYKNNYINIEVIKLEEYLKINSYIILDKNLIELKYIKNKLIEKNRSDINNKNESLTKNIAINLDENYFTLKDIEDILIEKFGFKLKMINEKYNIVKCNNCNKTIFSIDSKEIKTKEGEYYNYTYECSDCK